MPTLVGVTPLDGPKVEASPLTAGVVKVPAEPPPEVPVHGVLGALSLHQVKATEPVGAPPVEFPVMVAESVQVLPTEVSVGGLIVVTLVGVAGPTVKHSSLDASDEASYTPD